MVACKKADVENASFEELMQMRSWLFRENIRIEDEKEQLRQRMKDFEREKSGMLRKLTEQNSRNELESRQLESEKILFRHKWEILESAYRDLHEEQKKFEIEKQQLIGKRNDNVNLGHSTISSGVFFRGVNNSLALKKRYKDLIKIFHPDNVAGDHDTVQLINQEYSMLKEVY